MGPTRRESRSGIKLSDSDSAQTLSSAPSTEDFRIMHASEDGESHSHTYSDKNLFTKKEKWLIVGMVAFSSFFSPLTANIYFPAIPTLAAVFEKSTELINLTVVMYMLLQGIAPMVWGTLSDNVGRRPITMACLFVLSLSCIGLALVPTSAFWLLMLLRCMQAAGSASTIAIGAGVISDISTPEERGGFLGVAALGPLVGPSVGPIIGGALAQRLGWRSIFWFLCIAASICLIVIMFIMPETLPAVRYKNGEISKALYTPVVSIIGKKNKGNPIDLPQDLTPKKPFQNPFKLFTELDIVLLLIVNALTCAVSYGVITSIPTLFEQTYDFLDETKVGLCFLAIGGGMAVGSAISGKILDKWYVKEKRQFAEKFSTDFENLIDTKSVDKSPDFPLERARLSFIPVLVIISAACTAGYGWVLEKRVNIAVPLLLHIIMGFLRTAIMNGATTIIIDLAPGQGSAVAACNNLVRCLLSAAFVAVMDILLRSIGVGWTYVLLAGISLVTLPVIFLELKFGPQVRRKRLETTSKD